jgi:hypothetical protein
MIVVWLYKIEHDIYIRNSIDGRFIASKSDILIPWLKSQLIKVFYRDIVFFVIVKFIGKRQFQYYLDSSLYILIT